MVRRVFLFVVIVIGSALLAAAARAGTASVVDFSGFSPGTVVIKTQARQLFYVIDSGRALRFPVGVGRKGMTWTGRAVIEGKYIEPAWAAPDEIRADPTTPAEVIPGGSPRNPMGAAALTLRGGEYAIHGTNNPGSVGRFVSHGCFRMLNKDITALYRLVEVGTPVVVEQ